MKIQWLGHSSFKLEESTGSAIVTDPYKNSYPDVSADAVTISHLHDCHSFFQAVKGNPTILNKVGAFEIPGIHISSAMSTKKNSARENLIYKFRIDGVDICHLGDINEKCSINIIDFIGEVDVLLIPVSGKNIIEPELAKEYVDKLMPDIVIPMHFTKKDDNKLQDFLSLFEDNDIQYIKGSEIEVDRAQFDGECTKVVIFNN